MRLQSERKRSAISLRLCAVMSSITLMAMISRPSPSSTTGVAFTAHQRSSPVPQLAEADDRLALPLSHAAPGGRAGARAGTRAPDSSRSRSGP